VGAAVGALILSAAALRLNGHVFAGVSLAQMWSMAKRYRRFAFMSTPSALMNTIGLRAPLLILLFAFGTDVGGQYALAERVAILPVTLIAAAVSQVYYSHAAPLARRQDDALRSMFLRTTRSLALLAIAPMIIVVLAAPFLFGLVFGEDWTQAGIYSAILAPWFYVTLITNPTGRTLDVLERQDLHMVREGLRLGRLGATAVAILVLQPTPAGAMIMLSVVGCVTYGLYGYISWRAIVSDRPRPGVTQSGSDSDSAAAS
jgi:O-antigen/teichoic acid export membrane protein